MISPTAPHLLNLQSTFGESYAFAVSRFPTRAFLIWIRADGSRLQSSFQEFAEDVERVRSLIRDSSLEKTIVVCIDGNTPTNLIFMTAAWLEGRSVCPINPEEGLARIAQKIQALPEPSVIFAGVAHAEVFKPLGAVTMTIPEVVTIAKTDARPFAHSQPFAFIFTSGTTGYSKIVQQTEFGVLANVDALIERHDLLQPTRLATSLPVFHVNALEFVFLGALLSSNSIVLFEKFILPQLLSAIETEKIEILSLIPQMLSLLLKVNLDADAWSSVRYVVSAAAPLPPQIAAIAVRKLPCKVVQGYGLSEAINFSCLMPIDLPDADHRRWMSAYNRPSIGTALRGNEVMIIDDEGRGLGENEIGEVALRGSFLMAGYVGESPGVTFAGGFFRTGDIGCFRNDAIGTPYYFITGRKKETVKRMGITISLVEIDDLLMTLAIDAIAICFSHASSGEEIAVMVRSKPGVSIGKVRDAVNATLPPHLRPRIYLECAEELRTPSGKACRWKFVERLGAFHDAVLSADGLLVELAKDLTRHGKPST